MQQNTIPSQLHINSAFQSQTILVAQSTAPSRVSPTLLQSFQYFQIRSRIIPQIQKKTINFLSRDTLQHNEKFANKGGRIGALRGFLADQNHGGALTSVIFNLILQHMQGCRVHFLKHLDPPENSSNQTEDKTIFVGCMLMMIWPSLNLYKYQEGNSADTPMKQQRMSRTNFDSHWNNSANGIPYTRRAQNSSVSTRTGPTPRQSPPCTSRPRLAGASWQFPIMPTKQLPHAGPG